MAIPLASILSAAPGVISAASDIIKVIKQRQGQGDNSSPQPDHQLQEVVNLIERQAQVIEDLAEANQQLALAVRNNRIIAFGAGAIAFIALLAVVVLV